MPKINARAQVVNEKRELPFVREMFNAIAPHYDFLNRLLSLRQDVSWRRALVSALDLRPGMKVLDVACGTADVALEVQRRTAGAVFVVGADFAPEMLRRAQPKIAAENSRGPIPLLAADGFHLPFGPERFDALTIAFGIRNIRDKATVLRRFYDHLKPGGRLAVLELSTPDQPLLRQAYLTYFDHLLPLSGRLFSRHTFAYSYLPASVAQFPPASVFAGLMRSAGFRQVRWRKLTMGVAVLFIGERGKLNADSQ